MVEDESLQARYRIRVQKGTSLAKRLAAMEEKDLRQWLLTAVNLFHILTLEEGARPALVEVFEKGLLSREIVLPPIKAKRNRRATKVSETTSNTATATGTSATPGAGTDEVVQLESETVATNTSEAVPVKVVRRNISLKGVAEGARRAYER